MAIARRIQHTSLAVPPAPDSLERALAFYRDALGLTPVPVPDALSDRNVLAWFKVGDDELHLFIHDNPRNAEMRHHPCLEVDDLRGVWSALERAGYRPEEATPIPGRPRFFCRDPFGNLLEFTVIERSS